MAGVMTALAAEPVSKRSAIRCTDSPSMVAAAAPESRDETRYGAGDGPRRRALVLAVVLHILVGLLLVLQKAAPIVKMERRGLSAIMLPAPSKNGTKQDKSEHKAEKRTQPKRDKAEKTPVAVTPPPPSQPPPIVPNNLQKPSFIVLSSQDYAASNIGKQPSLRSASAATGQDGGPAGPGAGPGGATLYPADWFREPTDAELGGYLKPDMPRSGWGQIACRTVARHRVEDCYVLGESPRGSGFGRSVLNASWQFQVLAPRVNGREQLGTWVSIRITYTEGNTKAGPG